MKGVWVIAIQLVFAVGAIAPRAEVIDASTNGFTISNAVHIEAPSKRVYSALVEEVGLWWDSDHTFSGESKNLSIEAKAGGCFCERLGEQGQVQHLEVVFVDPPKMIRMRGGLGPLQDMGAFGALTWALSGTGTTTELVLTYKVGGYDANGLQNLAEPVDGVLAGQLARLKRYIEEVSP